MSNQTLLLKSKVQVIYYQTSQDDLGVAYATSEKRITIDEAFDILLEREKECKEVLKVKYENMEVELPIEVFEKYNIE